MTPGDDEPHPVAHDADMRCDGQLMQAVRDGHMTAFAVLYERHITAARSYARRLALPACDVEDPVSGAFENILRVLRSGRGPESAFRAYLFTAIRHIVYTKARKDRRVELVADMTTDIDPKVLCVPANDAVVSRSERTTLALAFRGLPGRWRFVLWLTLVEEWRPAELAECLGLTSNGASALIARARHGLRRAYCDAKPVLATTARPASRTMIGCERQPRPDRATPPVRGRHRSARPGSG